jgi:hypothetical protein
MLYDDRFDVRAPESPVTVVDSPVAATSPQRRTLVVLALVTLPEATVLAVVVGVVLGPLPAVAVFAAVAAGAAAVIWSRSGGVGERDLPGAPADPAVHARLLNLVDGLCVTAGVRTPAVRVVEESGANLAVAGREAVRASLVVTAGLVDGLTRMELEGILAVGIVGIRRGDTRPATVAAVTGVGVALALATHRDLVVDGAAAALTRYPPGLAAAYRKLQSVGTAVPGQAGRTAHLWLADPTPDAATPPYRTPLAQRIDALADL